MNTKRVVYGICVLAVMTVIFLFSNYPGIDEWYQNFMNKRNARFTDVCIDEFGVVISMI